MLETYVSNRRRNRCGHETYRKKGKNNEPKTWRKNKNKNTKKNLKSVKDIKGDTFLLESPVLIF